MNCGDQKMTGKTGIICIDCEQEIYINYTEKSRGCKVCGWKTFFRDASLQTKENLGEKI